MRKFRNRFATAPKRPFALLKVSNASANSNFLAPRPCSPTFRRLEAMMPANALTIQDASETFWKLAGSDLFVLAKPDGQVVALHVTRPGWSAANAQRDLKRSIDLGEDASWWYDDGRLYWVFLHPIISGAGETTRQEGTLAVGYQVDSAVAQQLAIAANNQIALTTADTVDCFHFTWRRRG